MKLYPSILTSLLTEFKKQLAWIINSQVIDVIQIDVIDGCFADNLTLTPSDLTQVNYGDLQLDFHLMTQEPMDYVRELVSIKDDLPIRAVISQVERMSAQHNYLQELRAQDWKTGLSLDLYTQVEAIDPQSWQDLDMVQLMTIKSGFQSQEFNQNALEKIVEIRRLSQEAKNDLEIIVDGGVKKKQLKLLKKHKIDGIVVGSGLWKSDDPVKAIIEYSRLIEHAHSD